MSESQLVKQHHSEVQDGPEKRTSEKPSHDPLEEYRANGHKWGIWSNSLSDSLPSLELIPDSQSDFGGLVLEKNDFSASAELKSDKPSASAGSGKVGETDSGPYRSR